MSLPSVHARAHPQDPRRPAGRMIYVLDSKASQSMQLSHQTQIAFYALLLDALIQARGLASLWRVAPAGGTADWLEATGGSIQPLLVIADACVDSMFVCVNQ